MSLTYIFIFIISLFLTIIFTLLIKKIAWRFKIIDDPSLSPQRKIHQQPVPLLGGIAIFTAFFLTLLIVKEIGWWPIKSHILNKNLWGFFFASCVLMIGGFLDDKYKLKPRQQIIFPLLASLIVIIFGIGIRYINNPFGHGYLHLDSVRLEIMRWQGMPLYFTWLTDIFTLVWLMVLMYSTKLLDGLDGLVSSISFVGFLIIFALCALTKFLQPDVGILSLIVAGSFLGFLFFNFHPAKIFLGESGSLFAGFTLGLLAIISGGKIATALMVVGIAVIDLLWIFIKRLLIDRKSPFSGGVDHLHFRLLNLGWSQKKIVLFYSLIAFGFGLISLFIPSTIIKIAILIVLFLSIFTVITLANIKSHD